MSVKDGADLRATQLKTKQKTMFLKTWITIGLGAVLCLSLKMVTGASLKRTLLMAQEVGMLLLPTGISHLLWLMHRMKVGAKETGHLLSLKKQTMKLEIGTKLELRTKLVTAIGINRNLLVVMVGTRVMIRIAVGTGLEILEVDVALGKDEGEVGARNLEISMAEMIKEVGRIHGVVTMLKDPPGGLIIR
jgi:hypothetical protein